MSNISIEFSGDRLEIDFLKFVDAFGVKITNRNNQTNFISISKTDAQKVVEFLMNHIETNEVKND